MTGVQTCALPIYCAERHWFARAAVMALRAHAEQTNDAPRNHEYDIRTDLVVRESTGFPRGTMTHLGKPITKK